MCTRLTFLAENQFQKLIQCFLFCSPYHTFCHAVLPPLHEACGIDFQHVMTQINQSINQSIKNFKSGLSKFTARSTKTMTKAWVFFANLATSFTVPLPFSCLSALIEIILSSL